MLKPCKQCGCNFEASKARKVFCSPECRIIGTREARIANMVGSRKEAACINKKIRAVHRKVPDPLAENGHPPLPNTEVRICTVCNHPYSATFSLQKYGSIYCYRREENKRASEKRRRKIVTCAICGSSFYRERGIAKFCSEECKEARRGENQRSKYQAYLSRQKALKEEVEKAWVNVPDPKKENCHPPVEGDFLIKTCRYCKFPFTAIETDRIYGHPNCRKSALRSGNRASEKVFTPKENKTTAYARKLRSNPF